MGIVRGSFVIGAVATAAFLKIPAFAENPAEPPKPKQVSSERQKTPKKLRSRTSRLPRWRPKRSICSGRPKEEAGQEATSLPPHFLSRSLDCLAGSPTVRFLLFVSMSGCHHCDKMMAESYHAPEMKQMISESFEPVYVTRKAHPKLVKSLKVRWYPTTVLVGAEQQSDGRDRGIRRHEDVPTAYCRRAWHAGKSPGKNPVTDTSFSSGVVGQKCCFKCGGIHTAGSCSGDDIGY